MQPRVGQGLVRAALTLQQARAMRPDVAFASARAASALVRPPTERSLPTPPPAPFVGDAVVIAPNGVNVWQQVFESGHSTWRFLTNLPRFSVALIERFEGPFVYLRFDPRGEGYASFLDPSSRRPNFQKIETRVGGVPRIGQRALGRLSSLPTYVLTRAVDAYDGLLRLLQSGGATLNLAQSLVTRIRALANIDGREAIVLGPAASYNYRPMFGLPIFTLRPPLRGVVGWLLGGRRVRILASVPERNVALVRTIDPAIQGPDPAHAFDVQTPVEGWVQLDWVRPTEGGAGSAPAPVIGQGLVDVALRLDAAKRAQAELAERVLRQGQAAQGQPARSPASDMVLSRTALEEARRRGGFLDVSRPRGPSRAALLAKYGIIEGRAIIDRPRGIQIWSHPAGEYRPGTGIPLMMRLFVLPQGTRVFLTPNAPLLDAVLNNDGYDAGNRGSYHVQWNVVGDPIAAVFQALGIPESGTGWARPYAPDGGVYFRSLQPGPVLT